MHSQVSIVGLY